jgi:glycosyltransferase involved in cell wall biosynthesis
MRKKVLLITSRIPYPPIGGDKLKNFNLLKILSKHYDVYLVIVTDEELNLKSEEVLKNFTVNLKIFTKSKYKFYFNACRSLFNQLPLQVNYYYFNDVKNYIDNISSKVDFAISTLIRTSEYLKDFNKPKYLDIVDSIGLNYKRSINNVRSIFWKLIYKIEMERVLKYEEKSISKFNNTFFVNKFEADYWAKYGKTTWIPNGVNEELFNYNKKNKKYNNYIAFFGKMDYQPNIDAVLWFVENVFKYLNKDIKFVIVGTNPTTKIRKLSKKYKNIEVTGFVKDPYEILNSSLLVVSPMQTGGGIQNKILESMALGIINIVSSLAAKPIIGAKDKEHLLICDDPLKMAELINDIYLNVNKYSFIKENARKLIKEKYTWKNYENELLKMIRGNLSDIL